MKLDHFWSVQTSQGRLKDVENCNFDTKEVNYCAKADSWFLGRLTLALLTGKSPSMVMTDITI